MDEEQILPWPQTAESLAAEAQRHLADEGALIGISAEEDSAG